MPRRSEPKQPKGEAEDLYGLFIQGLPRNLGWQDLKDQIRQICPNTKVKHAEVTEAGDGVNDGISHIIINGKDSAEKAYRHLGANGFVGKPVTVALAKARHKYESNTYQFDPYLPSTTSPAPRGKTLYNPKGPSSTLPTPSGTPAGSRRGSLTTSYASQMSPSYAQMYGVQHTGLPSPVDMMAPYTFGAVYAPTAASGMPRNFSSGSLSRQAVPQQGVPTRPVAGYVPTAFANAGPMVTTHRQKVGAVPRAAVPHAPRAAPTGPSATQNRTVFVQNLDPSVTWSILKDRLRRAGEVSRCEVKPECVSQTAGRLPRHWALVTFFDVESAERAVKFFDGYELSGRRMRVRLSHDDRHPNGRSLGSRGQGKGNGSSGGGRKGRKGTPRSPSATSTSPSGGICLPESDDPGTAPAAAARKPGDGPLIIDGNKARYSTDEDEEDDDGDDEAIEEEDDEDDDEEEDEDEDENEEGGEAESTQSSETPDESEQDSDDDDDDAMTETIDGVKGLGI